MPLPPPAPRSHLHKRTCVYHGYLRDDGLFDIEAELKDTKSQPFRRHDEEVPAGAPIHGMLIRATVNEAMTIVEIAGAMDDTPFGECRGSLEPLQAMVGATMGPGWRAAIERALGQDRGCTHLRELLFNMATAAFQTITAHQYAEEATQAPTAQAGSEPPYYMGKCLAWAFDGAVAKRLRPEFAGWQPLKPARRTPGEA